MFEKNDRQLLTMRILLNIVTVILVLLGVILGIIYLATGATALGLVLLLLIPFLCWLMWLSSRLFLTYLCDIKLIRNKLYGVDNDILKVFLEDDKDDALILLYNLYEQGILTEEEYTTEKSAFLNSENEHNKSFKEKYKLLAKVKRMLDKEFISQEDFEKAKKSILK